MTIHQKYIQRCLELARLGAGYVAPNPMVGAVLVYEGRIIGEGWHQQYGKAHAEVNCIASVKEEDRNLISQSILYVSLEPCAHHGKTPPCADLIIQHKIPRVVIGCRDPFKEVDARLNDAVGQGKGIEKLKAAEVEVEVGILEKECKELNKRFFTFHTLHRPYVILKWAQTADGKMAASPSPSAGGVLASGTSNSYIEFENSQNPPSEGREARLLISNEYSNRLVHKWRSEEASILVGTNTAMLDDPELTTRLWSGSSPVRLVVDMNLRLPSSLKIFNQPVRTIIFNTKVHSKESESVTPSPFMEQPNKAKVGNVVRGVRYYQVTNDVSLVHQIMNALYQLKIQSVLVEGGAKLLRSFIEDGLWDEIRIIHNYSLNAGDGLDAPKPENAILVGSGELFSDTIETYVPATEDY